MRCRTKAPSRLQISGLPLIATDAKSAVGRQTTAGTTAQIRSKPADGADGSRIQRIDIGLSGTGGTHRSGAVAILEEAAGADRGDDSFDRRRHGLEPASPEVEEHSKPVSTPLASTPRRTSKDGSSGSTLRRRQHVHLLRQAGDFPARAQAPKVVMSISGFPSRSDDSAWTRAVANSLAR